MAVNNLLDQIVGGALSPEMLPLLSVRDIVNIFREMELSEELDGDIDEV